MCSSLVLALQQLVREAENPLGAGHRAHFATVLIQARAGKRQEHHPPPTLSAPLPFSVAPHHTGMGCAVPSTGTGFADMCWGISSQWTTLTKRCKSLTQPRVGRQAATCDRHVHAQHGWGQGAAAPIFAPSPPTCAQIMPGELSQALGVVAAPCPQVTH